MKKTLAFDMPHYIQLNGAELNFLKKWLPELVRAQDIKNVLDVGCGAGFFASYLAGLGLRVIGLDARSENVFEAQKRNQGIDFVVENIENLSVRKLGSFDLTFCFGLLYHLENPFLAIRNLHAMTGKMLLIESIITPGAYPSAKIIEEGISEDQSVNYIALIPSEAGFIKMLYSAGFKNVYISEMMPDHEDFRESFKSRRKRTIMVAAEMLLEMPFLRRVEKPVTIEPWIKPLGYRLNRINLFVNKPWKQKFISAKYHLRSMWLS